VNKDRVLKSWGPSSVGLKLTCFQVRYILDVGRPNHEGDINQNFQVSISHSFFDLFHFIFCKFTTTKRLNKLYGRPDAKMTSDFQQTVKKVQAIANYEDWFLFC